MGSAWMRRAATVGAFVAAWVSVALLQKGFFNLEQARFAETVYAGLPSGELAKVDPSIEGLWNRGLWQSLAGVVLLLAVLVVPRWTRSGLMAAGIAVGVVSLAGMMAQMAEYLPGVFLVDFVFLGAESVPLVPYVSATDFLARGAGIVVGASLALAGLLSRPRSTSHPTRGRAGGAVLGVLGALAGTAALTVGVSINYRSLLRLEATWPTDGLFGLMPREPVQADGLVLLLLGAALMAGSFTSVRRTSIGVWATGGIWFALAVVTMAFPEVLVADDMVTRGTALVGEWFGVLALVTATLGFATLPRRPSLGLEPKSGALRTCRSAR